MMSEEIKCPDCGTVNHLNPNKHPYRAKFCVECHAKIAKPTKQFGLLRRIRKKIDKWTLRNKRNTHIANTSRSGVTMTPKGTNKQ